MSHWRYLDYVFLEGIVILTLTIYIHIILHIHTLYMICNVMIECWIRIETTIYNNETWDFSDSIEL